VQQQCATIQEKLKRLETTILDCQLNARGQQLVSQYSGLI
jgi:hypothetical protein